MKKAIYALSLFLVITTACNQSNTEKISFDKKIQLSISNPADIVRADEQVAIDVNTIKEKYNDFNANAVIVTVGETEIPSQLYDSNLDGSTDQILVNVYLQPKEAREITIYYSDRANVKTEYKNRTYAELAVKQDYSFENGVYKGGRYVNVTEYRVPDDHIDHNKLMKYEGPGWESENVGYRFYLDWRNATDIFGKKTKDLVLQNVGLGDTDSKNDSYHEMSDWGMDIFKVGSTLGLGSIATMLEDKIIMVSETDSITWKLLCNGPLRSEFITTYYGWKVGDEKYNLYARTSIDAGSRLTEVQLNVDGIDNITTGFARHENVPEMIKSDDDGGWQFISSYGIQSLSEDNLGIAVFYNHDVTTKQDSDKDNQFVVLSPVDGKVKYYFAAVWEKETEPIIGKVEFIEYLQQTEHKLNNPIQVIVE